MMRTKRLLLLALLAAGGATAAGCGDRFSPDTYATRAVQQADRVEQGIVVGVRRVRISADGTVGAATGAAAGGVLGAQTPGAGIVSALGGVGGALVGGLIGRGAESAVVDTDAHEYIVRTTRDELMRVTQQDREPLTRGQRVLLITGVQARVVPDYTLPPEGPAPEPATAAANPTRQSVSPASAPVGATPLAPIAAPSPEGAAAPAAAGLVPAYPSVPPPPPAAPTPEGQTPRPGAAAAGVDTPVTDG